MFVLLPAFLTGCGNSELPQALEAAAAPVHAAATQAAQAAQEAAAAAEAAAVQETAAAVPGETYETMITFSETEPPQIEGGGASVSAAGVVIQAGGRYTVRGTLGAGTLEVYAPGADVEVVLENASITSVTAPALYLSGANSVTVTAQEGTQNTIAGGSKEFAGAVYSNAPLTLAGTGYLDVNGLTQNAVMIRGDLTIASGHLTVQAARGGITASRVQIADGSIYVNSKLNAIEAAGRLEITGGTVFAFAGEQNNTYGLRAAGGVTISGGEVISTAGFVQTLAEGSQPQVSFTYPVERSSTTFHIFQNGEQIRVFESPASSKAMQYSIASLTPGSACSLQVGGAEIAQGTAG